MRKIDISYKKFGRLTALERSENCSGKTMWKCLCDCGNIVYVTTSNLTCNRIKSCGCLKKEILENRNITHNQRNTKLYEVWKAIKQRCLNPNNHTYHNYGGRGITICDEWKNDFEAFYKWSYDNGYNLDEQKDEKRKLTIDRIDVNGNYEPSNCRWVTRKIQADNMRHTKHITINGKTKNISEWCRELNISSWQYYKNIKEGMPPEKALTK